MTKIPLTRIAAEQEKAEALRAAVRSVRLPEEGPRKLADLEDTRRFYDFIRDPSVSEPIYTLPKPITPASTRAFIERHMEEQLRGEGLLMLEIGARDRVAGYHDFQFWPEWSACEVGGAINRELQSMGVGGGGTRPSSYWEIGKAAWRAVRNENAETSG